MAKKVENKEEILEAVEETEKTVAETAAEFDFDIDDILGDDPSLENVFKVAGVAIGAVGTAAVGYMASKKDIFGKIKESQREKRYQKALLIVDKHDHPENYEIEEIPEATDAKPEKKSKKTK